MPAATDHLPAPKRSLWVTAWLSLLLAMIAGYALLPVGSPLVRQSGSAFSATTVEVSLGPSRRVEVAAARPQIGPSEPPVPAMQQAPLPIVTAPVAHQPAPVWPQAPPSTLPDDPATTAFDARGPPRT